MIKFIINFFRNKSKKRMDDNIILVYKYNFGRYKNYYVDGRTSQIYRNATIIEDGLDIICLENNKYSSDYIILNPKHKLYKVKDKRFYGFFELSANKILLLIEMDDGEITLVNNIDKKRFTLEVDYTEDNIKILNKL